MTDSAEELDPTMLEGLWAPEYCPRGRTDCKSLSFIIAHGHTSFMCCGENDGATRELEQDRYRVCFRSPEVDDMTDYDKRDITQTAAVLMGALAIIEERDSDAYHDPTAEQSPRSSESEA